jgi:hypothetical protein
MFRFVAGAQKLAVKAMHLVGFGADENFVTLSL